MRLSEFIPSFYALIRLNALQREFFLIYHNVKSINPGIGPTGTPKRGCRGSFPEVKRRLACLHAYRQRGTPLAADVSSSRNCDLWAPGGDPVLIACTDLALPDAHPIGRREVELVSGQHLVGVVPRVEVAHRVSSVLRGRMAVGHHLAAQRLLAALLAPALRIT